MSDEKLNGPPVFWVTPLPDDSRTPEQRAAESEWLSHKYAMGAARSQTRHSPDGEQWYQLSVGDVAKPKYSAFYGDSSGMLLGRLSEAYKQAARIAEAKDAVCDAAKALVECDSLNVEFSPERDELLKRRVTVFAEFKAAVDALNEVEGE